MPLNSFRERALLLKVESTEGTDAVPTPALDAFQLFDGSSGVAGDVVEREIDRPYFTNNPFVVANPRAFIEGSFEIVPPAVPGNVTTGIAAIDALLRIGGMARTLVASPGQTRYNPISTAIPSGTAYWYHAGTHKKVTGARAALSAIEMAVGNYMRGQLRIEGNYQTVDEATVTGLVYTPFAAPRVGSTESMALSCNGFNVEGKSLSIDFGTEQRTIEHTEARLNRITDRRATFTARMYRPTLASFNPWTLWRVGTIIPIVGIHNEIDNRVTRLEVNAQIEGINEVDIDGDLGLEITGRCIATSAGGDEFVLRFNAP
jgi:hypothetical protein